jgi:CheY-like chemotaxis protein
MSRTTILHVEDDSNDVLLMRHACERAGVSCKLEAVGDGDEAIAYLSGQDGFQDRDTHPLPNLVLLDLKMPRVNGFEVLSWIRGAEQFRNLPVVVLTSSNRDADVQKAYNVGANSYLVKPVDFNALTELIKSVHHYWFRLNEALAP